MSNTDKTLRPSLNWEDTSFATAYFQWIRASGPDRGKTLPAIFAGLRFTVADYLAVTSSLEATLDQTKRLHRLWTWLRWCGILSLVLVAAHLLFVKSNYEVLLYTGISLVLGIAATIPLTRTARRREHNAQLLEHSLSFAYSTSASQRKLMEYLREAQGNNNTQAIEFIEHLLSRGLPLTCFEDAILVHQLVLHQWTDHTSPTAATRQ